MTANFLSPLFTVFRTGVWTVEWNSVLVRLWLYPVLGKWSVLVLITNYVTISYHIPSVSMICVLLFSKLYFHHHIGWIVFPRFKIVQFDSLHYINFFITDGLLVLYSIIMWSKFECTSLDCNSITLQPYYAAAHF